MFNFFFIIHCSKLLSVFLLARSPWIRHWDELTKRDWENAVQGLGNEHHIQAFYRVPLSLGYNSFNLYQLYQMT